MLKGCQFILLYFGAQAFALSPSGEKSLKLFLKERDYYSRTNLKYLKEGRLISTSKVIDAPKGKHKAWAKAAGFHTSKCSPVLKVISRYEDYKKYMSFVSTSQYYQDIFSLVFKVSILPVEFFATMKIDRVFKPGTYSFTFIGKSFKGSKGEIVVQEIEQRCLMYVRLDLDVNDLGYPDFIMENFYTTVAKLGLRKLFQVSGHRMKT